jgi:hypothetical protein
VTEGLRIIGSEIVLPPLAPATIMIYHRAGLDDEAQSLAGHVRRNLN